MNHLRIEFGWDRPVWNRTGRPRTLNQGFHADSSDQRVAMGLFRRLLQKLKAKDRVTAREARNVEDLIRAVEWATWREREMQAPPLSEEPRPSIADCVEASLLEEVECRTFPSTNEPLLTS
jgi:hypothetical protein